MTGRKNIILKIFVILVSPVLMIYLWYPKTGFAFKQINSFYAPDTLQAPFGFKITFREKTVSSWKDDITTLFLQKNHLKKYIYRKSVMNMKVEVVFLEKELTLT
jgi:hypothetical protein